MAQKKELGEFKVYPNPSDGKVMISSPEFALPLNFKVYSSSGELIKKGIFNGGKTLLDLSDRENGIYLLKINNGKERNSLKLVLQ